AKPPRKSFLFELLPFAVGRSSLWPNEVAGGTDQPATGGRLCTGQFRPWLSLCRELFQAGRLVKKYQAASTRRPRSGWAAFARRQAHCAVFPRRQRPHPVLARNHRTRRQRSARLFWNRKRFLLVTG